MAAINGGHMKRWQNQTKNRNVADWARSVTVIFTRRVSVN
jgi:hypothetical protein